MTWTTEAPKEPGWYWWRMRSGYTVPTQIYPDGSCLLGRPFEMGGEWWPVRIEEPPQ